jgi:hypothetical protein
MVASSVTPERAEGVETAAALMPAGVRVASGVPSPAPDQTPSATVIRTWYLQ